MKIERVLTDETILAELGGRLAQRRLELQRPAAHRSAEAEGQGTSTGSPEENAGDRADVCLARCAEASAIRWELMTCFPA